MDLLKNHIRERDAAIVVTDFSPIRIQRSWINELAFQISSPLLEVDAHNIVPAWHISQKQEFQAATIRPKIHRMLPEFLDIFPDREEYRMGEPIHASNNDFKHILTTAQTDRTVAPVEWIEPGTIAAD